MEEELKIYNYVKDKSSEYLPVILRAITDGISEENTRLKHQKADVESGLIVLADKVKLDKIDIRLKSVLKKALESCTFLKVDSFIKSLTS